MFVFIILLIGLLLLPPSMPRRHPRVFHLMPYILGDSLGALTRAVLRRYKFIDQNGNCDANLVVWIMHWATLWTGGYRWIWTGHKDAKGREIRKRFKGNIHQLPTHQVELLRTKKRGGKRPWTAKQHIDYIADHHLKIALCLELKGGPWPVLTLRDLRTYAESRGVRVILMTLTNGRGGIPGWRNRVDNALEAGWTEVAVLPRCAKPNDWERKYDGRVAVWGSWR